MLLSLCVCVYASNIVQRPVMAPDGAVDGVRWFSAGDARHYVVGIGPMCTRTAAAGAVSYCSIAHP